MKDDLVVWHARQVSSNRIILNRKNGINDASKSELQEAEEQISESLIPYHSKVNIQYIVFTIFSVLHLKKCLKTHFLGGQSSIWRKNNL